MELRFLVLFLNFSTKKKWESFYCGVNGTFGVLSKHRVGNVKQNLKTWLLCKSDI